MRKMILIGVLFSHFVSAQPCEKMFEQRDTTADSSFTERVENELHTKPAVNAQTTVLIGSAFHPLNPWPKFHWNLLNDPHLK